MELINQHTKRIMEGCKVRARQAGLRFEDETLEYIVTNRDLIELTPKVMIPTLYDYWVHDVEVLREKGKYELYPSNPFETVINTRPAISYYNDNNPDWLNVMIFYHVLAHIDFFQNNLFFRQTWDDDLTGKALSDKRAIAELRAQKGRWVDYVIEFARGVDNLVGYYSELSRINRPRYKTVSSRVDYYFDVFLQDVQKRRISHYVKEMERYNIAMKENGELGEDLFFKIITQRYPEFDALYEKFIKEVPVQRMDVLAYLLKHSRFLNNEKNLWMKQILQVVRSTSLYFQPQIRTKIMNEGWASYWHETLFFNDDRIKGHEVDFARVNASVTSMPRVGLNPYALGMRLFSYIEEMADKGRLGYAFQRLTDANTRKKFDTQTGKGRREIFDVRENHSDFTFIQTFLDQDFVDRHRLFVTGRRLNEERMVWEYYVKSRNAEDYRSMLTDSMYHPPYVVIDTEKTDDTLYLNHMFEGKPLVKEYILNTLLGVEFLWGAPVKLETSEVKAIRDTPLKEQKPDRIGKEVIWERVIYTMNNRKLERTSLGEKSDDSDLLIFL
jgi:stage V sporulation protein R